jgi:hypothetical protein
MEQEISPDLSCKQDCVELAATALGHMHLLNRDMTSALQLLVFFLI